MKVLVTGGCGFLGSHICEFYARRGDRVLSYDLMTKHELQRNPYSADAAREYNWNYLKSLGVDCVKADVRDLEALADYASGCDFIAHTAAQPTMTIGLENPELDFSTNVLGTFNALTTARRHGIPMASCATIHIYGNELNANLREEASRYACEPPAFSEALPVLQGEITPLHASKMAADIYVRMFIDSYGVKAASFRLSGIYGPRQFGGEDHGWVANFAIRAYMGLPVKVFHNGKQLRDIIYASDVAQAFHAFYEKQAPGVYNVGGGPENTLSLLECIRMIEALLGKKIAVEFAGERFGDLYYFVCDIAKAQRQLAWSPRVSPREGVERLMTWMTENAALFTLPPTA
jgi:CDP-paratose 2-epimerase